MHDVLRRVAIGDLTPEDAPSEFADRYDTEIFNTTKPETMDAVYTDCLTFLAEYNYQYLDEYEVVAAEDHLEFEVEGVKMHGYIDLLLRDKNGDYIVMDYKSCKPFYGKRGNILKAMQSTYEEYLKQMCLYCIAVEQNYGKTPTKVMWLHFRHQAMTEHDVSREEIEATKKWVKDVTDRIKNDKVFPPCKDWFRCTNICDYRHTCEYLLFDDEEEGD